MSGSGKRVVAEAVTSELMVTSRVITNNLHGLNITKLSPELLLKPKYQEKVAVIMCAVNYVLLILAVVQQKIA